MSCPTPTPTADGRPLAVRVHGVDAQDREGARSVRSRSRHSSRLVERVFTDGNHAGWLVGWVQDAATVALENGRRPKGAMGLMALRLYRAVERKRSA